ncbi:MAG: DUF2800 domain-containing protein, partial [Clostridia bacterium]|nr:DUF2800 domain-containing protein [Clostridia bacterium]
VAAIVKNAGFDPFETKVVGICEMKKRLGGDKKMNKLIGKYIVKPQGKPTLAPETDSRPAFSSAAEDFKED